MSNDVIPLFDELIYPRWFDHDALGHINHVQYFRYLEEARVNWIVRGQLEALSAGGKHAMVVASGGLDFRAEWRHPNPLRARAWTRRIGNTSFTLYQTLHSEDGGIIVADGDMVFVWVDVEEHRPHPLNPALRELLAGSLLGE